MSSNNVYWLNILVFIVALVVFVGLGLSIAGLVIAMGDDVSLGLPLLFCGVILLVTIFSVISIQRMRTQRLGRVSSAIILTQSDVIQQNLKNVYVIDNPPGYGDHSTNAGLKMNNELPLPPPPYSRI